MTVIKSWRVNGVGHVTLKGENGNEWRGLVGNPEGKVTIARHEYRHLTSAVTILIRINSVVLWRSGFQNISIFSGN